MMLKAYFVISIYLYSHLGYAGDFEKQFKDVKIDNISQLITVDIYSTYSWGDGKIIEGSEAISKYCTSNVKCLLNKDSLYNVTRLYSKPSLESSVSGYVFVEYLKSPMKDRAPDFHESWIGTGEEIYYCYRCRRDPTKISTGTFLAVWDSKIISTVPWYRLPNSGSSELWFFTQEDRPSLGFVPIDGKISYNYIYTNLPASTLVQFDVSKSISLENLREKYKVDKSPADHFLVTKIEKGFVFFNYLVSDSEDCEKSESEKILIENKNAIELKLPINAFFNKNGFSKLGYIEGYVLDCKKLLSQSMMNK